MIKMKKSIETVFIVGILVILFGMVIFAVTANMERISLKNMVKSQVNSENGKTTRVHDSLLSQVTARDSSVRIYFGKNVVSLGNGEFWKFLPFQPLIPAGYIKISAYYAFDDDPYPAETSVYNSALNAVRGVNAIETIKGPHSVIAYGFFGFTTWSGCEYVNYNEFPDHGFRGKALVLIIEEI